MKEISIACIHRCLELILLENHRPTTILPSTKTDWPDEIECLSYFSNAERLSVAIDPKMGDLFNFVPLLHNQTRLFFLPSFVMNSVFFPDTELPDFLIWHIRSQSKSYLESPDTDDVFICRCQVITAFSEWALDDGISTEKEHSQLAVIIEKQMRWRLSPL
jgi:hypothetical protein